MTAFVGMILLSTALAAAFVLPIIYARSFQFGGINSQPDALRQINLQAV